MNESDAQFGLLATTRYVPRLRLERAEVAAQHRWMAPSLKSLAKGQRAMANWDEDVVTMAVDAARALLIAAPASGAAELTLASTTLPFADRLNAGIVAAAVGLDSATVTRDVASSARSALTELASAMRHPVTETTRIVVAAERRTAKPASPQELIFGDGAAVASVGPGRAIATFVAARTLHADLIDHFRQSGEPYVYGWEERWIRDEGYMKLATDTIGHCLADAGVGPSDVKYFALPAPISRINEAVAKRVGIAATALVATASDTVGDLGCAQPLAMLDMAVRAAEPGALILVAAFGSGCDVLLLKRTAAPCPGAIPDAGKSETSYLKYLSFTGQLDLAWGMRAEMDNKTALTAAWRDHARTERFEGGRCTRCDTVQFPRSRLCVNPACHAQDTQQPTSLAEVPARVMSHTTDFLGYTPDPPFQFGHIDFEGGGRVLMEFTDTDVGELAVGVPLRMVYRVKEFDRNRGFRRYFWKATPTRAAISSAPSSMGSK
ncbi:3-oxoacyl-[acyl-carrier-protein] synthase III C-terminal domain-containing protein [Variovorax sp. J22P168]|uniref:3-oxoacyl-[acyl-carrier-protein] synthase III C-terminal domain-containing protein n=1 Tax=Variovorax jilinensis TaxID=3053513 RepID=UPI00257833B6|nr:3-oxoacyl-[acyl-carrier-protein] synthase III C-terminal domain-containing protein [Variovorax sp. J22P168]MDM0015123.1 3-oxoacyl-[acyl-carrier-protein] synthase III C-terminal domain-containing protein [Variovorax sp. J22P168]